MNEIPVGISARHCHLSRADIDAIFGKGYDLIATKMLKQPGQYLCAERIKIKVSSGEFLSLGIIGPERERTQVEISSSDARKLKLGNVPIRASGDLEGAYGVTTMGGHTMLECTIVAKKHIHLSRTTAFTLGIKDKDTVTVNIKGKRRGDMLLCGIMARVGPEHADEFHIDCDEAAAFGLANGDKVIVL